MEKVIVIAGELGITERTIEKDLEENYKWYKGENTGPLTILAEKAEADCLLTIFIDKIPASALIEIEGHKVFVVMRKLPEESFSDYRGFVPQGNEKKRTQGAYKDEEGNVRWAYNDSLYEHEEGLSKH